MKGFILGLLCSLILIGIDFWTGYHRRKTEFYAENINYKMDKMMFYLGIEK